MINRDVTVSHNLKKVYPCETSLWMSLNDDWRKWCGHRTTIRSKLVFLRNASETIGPFLIYKMKKHSQESSCLTRYFLKKKAKILKTNHIHRSHSANEDAMYRSWCFLGSSIVVQIVVSGLKSSTHLYSTTSTILCKMMILITACICP